MSRSDPTPHRANTPDDRRPTADYFPDRAPLDHVPVWPAKAAGRREPFGFRWRDLALLAAIAALGVAALAGFWPW